MITIQRIVTAVIKSLHAIKHAVMLSQNFSSVNINSKSYKDGPYISSNNREKHLSSSSEDD